MNNASKLKSILLIAANPNGTRPLRLHEEEREIRDLLSSARYDDVTINSIGATRTRDIQKAMLKHKPQIVHFYGHGAGEDGLVFEDANGQEQLVTSDALADLFRLCSKYVECVVLNACHSTFQAELIVPHINYVIGMNQSIGDKAAIEFAVGFYTALCDGNSIDIEFSHQFGCNAIQIAALPEHLTPVLFQKNKMSTFNQNETTHNEVVKYLENYFIAKTLTPEIKTDFTGTLKEGDVSSVEFNFQIGIDKEISIESCILEQWTQIIDEQPVVLVLICVESLSDHAFSYCFKLFHEWLLDYPERIDLIKSEDSIIFSRDEFISIDGTNNSFQATMLEEAKRVLKRETLWRVKPPLILPITEIGLLKNLGHLSSLEVSEELIKETFLGRSTTPDAWHFLHEALVNPEHLMGESNQLPQVKSWLAQLLDPPSKTSVDRERDEFRLFVRAMRQCKEGNPFRMPLFTYDQISCWRVFFQMFSESWRLLEAMLRSPKYFSDEQLMSGFLLASSLANVDDRATSDKGIILLEKAWKEFGTSQANVSRFPVIRQLHFCCAEADIKGAVDKCLNFTHRHSAKWELDLNRGYYMDKTDESFKRSLERKLKNPKYRDTKTSRISEMLLDFTKNAIE
jgi:hypothetical protein